VSEVRWGVSRKVIRFGGKRGGMDGGKQAGKRKRG